MTESSIGNTTENTDIEINQDQETLGPDFDRNAEKQRRKDIRKKLEKVISDTLGPDYKKNGKSKWIRGKEEEYYLVYLQRSLYGHEYSLEAGLGNKAEIQTGYNPDITFCYRRKGLIGIIQDQYLKVHGDKNVSEEELRAECNRYNDALLFDIPDGIEKFPDDYFYPSVNNEEVEKKLTLVKEFIEIYLLPWIEENAKK